jgi:hypothetical protein
MTDYTLLAPRRSWLGRTEDWLDSKGRGAWIAAMVLGFVFFWPLSPISPGPTAGVETRCSRCPAAPTGATWPATA